MKGQLSNCPHHKPLGQGYNTLVEKLTVNSHSGTLKTGKETFKSTVSSGFNLLRSSSSSSSGCFLLLFLWFFLVCLLTSQQPN